MAPMIDTRLLVGATFFRVVRSWRMAGELPISSLSAPVRRAQLLVFPSELRILQARPTTSTRRSALNGFSI